MTTGRPWHCHAPPTIADEDFLHTMVERRSLEMQLRRPFVVYDRDGMAEHLSILREEFDLIAANSPKSFQQVVASHAIHGVVLHLDVLTPDQLSLIEKLNAFTAWLPIVVLADRWNWEAVRQCGKIGVDAFVACAEEPEKKLTVITSALRAGGFRKLLTDMEKPPTTWPVRMKHAYESILANFPETLTVGELSSSLGVHRRYCEKEFRRTFGLSCIVQHLHLLVERRWYRVVYKARLLFTQDC
jgi:hypothetical protein